MEDSFKGILISSAIITLFMISIVNFIVMFPTEQGFTFSSLDNNTYLTLEGISSNYSNTGLDNVDSNLNTGYNEWDIEVGFMGSNTQKASKSSGDSYVTTMLSTLKIIVYEVFTTSDGSIHPVIKVLSLFTILAGIYVTIIFIKFIRTGI